MKNFILLVADSWRPKNAVAMRPKVLGSNSAAGSRFAKRAKHLSLAFRGGALDETKGTLSQRFGDVRRMTNLLRSLEAFGGTRYVISRVDDSRALLPTSRKRNSG